MLADKIIKTKVEEKPKEEPKEEPTDREIAEKKLYDSYHEKDYDEVIDIEW